MLCCFVCDLTDQAYTSLAVADLPSLTCWSTLTDPVVTLNAFVSLIAILKIYIWQGNAYCQFQEIDCDKLGRFVKAIAPKIVFVIVSVTKKFQTSQ